MKRAQKGGEIGTNGEFYEGGKFLPSTTLPKREGSASKKATHKVEIEPYVWVECPEGKRSIYRQLSGIHKYNRQTKTFSINPDINPNYMPNGPELIEKYNNGERFI